MIKSGSGTRQPMPILPEKLDSKVRFSSVGGLDGHVQCLREMVLLPMMYPEVFKQFHVQPPRGVLFHGPPGKNMLSRTNRSARACSLRAATQALLPLSSDNDVLVGFVVVPQKFLLMSCHMSKFKYKKYRVLHVWLTLWIDHSFLKRLWAQLVSRKAKSAARLTK